MTSVFLFAILREQSQKVVNQVKKINCKVMSAEKKYIEELFTDALPVNEKEVVKVLKPIITIQRNSKEIFLKDEKKLTVEDKILAYGLAKKLLKIREYIDSETISASEVYEKTGIKKGSIDYGFKSLRGKFLFGKGKSYEIPNYKVNEIIKRLQKKSQETKISKK